MSRFLITGGGGFIGSHLIRQLLRDGHEVHATVRPGSSTSRIDDLGSRLHRHTFDLRSESGLRRCVRAVEPDVIYHLAASPRRPARPDLEDVRAHMLDDMRMLIALLHGASTAVRPPAKIIRTGSLAEYGHASSPYAEADREQPLTTYAAGLVAAAHLVGALHPRLGFPVVTARLALIYGPDQSTEYLIPRLVENCLTGRYSTVCQPQDRRDVLHVDDAVAALVKMAGVPLSGSTILNVASGESHPVRELAERIVALTGADPALVDFTPEDPHLLLPDFRGLPNVAEARLSWQPTISLEEGFARTVEWARGRLAPDEPAITASQTR